MSLCTDHAFGHYADDGATLKDVVDALPKKMQGHFSSVYEPPPADEVVPSSGGVSGVGGSLVLGMRLSIRVWRSSVSSGL